MKQYHNNIRSIFLLIILLIIILSPVILFSQTTSDLEIKNTKPGSTEPKITITPQGDFSTNVPSEVGTITDIEPGALKIEKVPNNTRMTLSEEKLAVEGSINEGNISDPVAGDMIIGNQAQPATVPQAIIGTSSGLSVTNTFNSTGGELLSAMAYVDNSVYEMNPGDAGFVYKYMNVAGEGKIHADNSFHYYVKDHLGSTRRVLDETFADVEVIAYQAYGNQITLQTSSEDNTRDNFTGKELDKEGSYTSIDFDLTINNCTGRDVKIKIVGGEGTTEIKPSISVIGNTVLVKSTLTLYESKYIIALIIQIPDNTPAIDYLQETPEIYPAVELGSEVKVTLTENAADLATAMPPNGGFGVVNQSDAYVGLRLNYFGARYYDAEIGVWRSVDPVGEFFNSYSYTGGNPILLIDPTGMLVNNINDDQENNFLFTASNEDIEYYMGLNESAIQYEWSNVYTGWQVLTMAREHTGIDYSILDCSGFVRHVIEEATGITLPAIYNSGNFHKYSQLSPISENSIWGDVLQWGGHVAIHDPVSGCFWTNKQGGQEFSQGYLEVGVGARNVGYNSGIYPAKAWWGTPIRMLRINQ